MIIEKSPEFLNRDRHAMVFSKPDLMSQHYMANQRVVATSTIPCHIHLISEIILNMTDVPLPISPKPLPSTSPKRPSISPKKKINPIVRNHLKYTISTVKNDAVTYIAAIMRAHDAAEYLVWEQEIYRIEFDLKLETDVQEVYPVSMALSASGNAILIENEHGAQFEIQLRSRKVLKIK